MTLTRILAATFLAATTLSIRAQPLIAEPTSPNQNVRVAWAIDADGGVDGDEARGVEVTYASEIYPLDQMGLTYGYYDPEGLTRHAFLFSIEEHWPLSETIVPYGVAGFGYISNDIDSGTTADVARDGWYGKLGAGLLLKMTSSFDLYGEIAYLGSTDDLWLDDGKADSRNLLALVGFRFKY